MKHHPPITEGRIQQFNRDVRAPKDFKVTTEMLNLIMTSPSRHPNGQRLEKRFNVHLLTLPVDTMMLCDGGSEDWDLAKKL
ncbi:LOW QUALITY PROTEIN: hypothetical protein YC2023_039616 [Brassica napus]